MWHVLNHDNNFLKIQTKRGWFTINTKLPKRSKLFLKISITFRLWNYILYSRNKDFPFVQRMVIKG